METIKNIKLPDGNTYKIGGGLGDGISNCITALPQDIKLELNNGVLTLKAGSKVYMPNGFEADGTTPKFDEVVVGKDISTQALYSRQDMLCYSQPIDSINYVTSSWTYSGATAPTGQTYMFWYDTANNLVKYTDNGGSTWVSGRSLPLALFTSNSTQITSIDQIFNGFGYIGKTFFVLPGIECLIADGKNQDGTPKSIAYTTDKPQVVDAGYYYALNYVSVGPDGITVSQNYKEQTTQPSTTGTLWYEPDSNTMRRINNDNSVGPRREVYIGSGQFIVNNISEIFTQQPVQISSYENIKNKVGYDRVSNCITHTEQDIRYILNQNGTITFKAGSKFYIPNGKDGSNKNLYTVYTLPADQSAANPSASSAVSGKALIGYNTSNGRIQVVLQDDCQSGQSLSASNTGFYYYTNNNTLYYYNKNTNAFGKSSLPLASVTLSNSQITSVDAVFNGFGFIGSLVYSLPGVRGLIPCGRNPDGTLCSTEFVTTDVLINEKSSSWTQQQVQLISPFELSGLADYDYMYNEATNQIILKATAAIINKCAWGSAELTNGRVSNIVINTPVKLLDNSTPHITDTYKNGDSWYRVWSDGWCEQGGFINKDAASSYTTITFLKPFATRPMRAVYNAAKPSGAYPNYNNLLFVCDSFTATTMSVFTKNASNQLQTQYGYWYACGYIK